MMMKEPLMLLVGDNPFHGISHLSQERARTRSENLSDPDHAASLVEESIASGANGFMFSTSSMTLSILKALNATRGVEGSVALCPIVPYAYEYVRYAVQAGGLLGLAGRLSREVVS